MIITMMIVTMTKKVNFFSKAKENLTKRCKKRSTKSNNKFGDNTTTTDQIFETNFSFHVK